MPAELATESATEEEEEVVRHLILSLSSSLPSAENGIRWFDFVRDSAAKFTSLVLAAEPELD